jgi:hypothetical protein
LKESNEINEAAGERRNEEKPGDAVKSVSCSGRTRRVFEPIMIGGSGFLCAAKLSFHRDPRSSGWFKKLTMSFQEGLPIIFNSIINVRPE